MSGNDVFFIIEKIRKYWEHLYGLMCTILFIIFIYWYYFIPILKDQNIENIFIYPFIIIIIFILPVLWLFNTNRIFFRNDKTFVLGLILNVDENEAEEKIKKIVNKCTNEINQNFKKINIKVLPINYKKNEEQVEKLLKSYNSLYDAILFATVESGKITNQTKVDDKIIINKISFIGKFNVYENRKIFNSNITLATDLKIRDLFKDWAYISDNSFNDKKKIQQNLHDTILFYSGIYLIYLEKLDLSLDILKTLFNSKLSNIPKPIEDKIIISTEIFAACRLNNILLNLFYFTAFKKYYEKNDYLRGYNLLKECEETFPEHPDSFYHYIQLARFAYEIKKVSEAKIYTLKAQKKNRNSIEVLLNLAFFSIYEKNISELTKIYRKINNTIIHYYFNYADIIDFLDRQKNILKEQKELIDFSIGALNILHLDKKYGEQLLNEFINENELKKEFIPLIKLATEFITKKNNYYSKSKKRKKKLKNSKHL